MNCKFVSIAHLSMQLPGDLLVEIFYRLDGKTLCTCARVCQRWNEVLSTREEIWRNNVERSRKLGPLILCTDSWKLACIQSSKYYYNINQSSLITNLNASLIGLSLSALPTTLFTVSTLRILRLESNNLKSLPPQIGSLTEYEFQHVIDSNEFSGWGLYPLQKTHWRLFHVK